MINPYYFVNENLIIVFETNLESHIINHGNSILTIAPIFLDIAIETRYNSNFFKKIATIYARLVNH